MVGVVVRFDRRLWTLTSSDIFMDNGACVQLMTQVYHDPSNFGAACHSVLTKALEKRWKKEGILYTNDSLDALLKKHYANRVSLPSLKYYKVDIEKLIMSGIGVLEVKENMTEVPKIPARFKN